MEENIKNTTVEEELEEQKDAEQPMTEDPLKEAIEAQFKKISRQNMLIGFQTACRVVIEKLIVAESQPGKRTMNDYKRLFKDLKQFCEIGLSRKINEDGEPEPIEEESAAEETVQN